MLHLLPLASCLLPLVLTAGPLQTVRSTADQSRAKVSEIRSRQMALRGEMS